MTGARLRLTVGAAVAAVLALTVGLAGASGAAARPKHKRPHVGEGALIVGLGDSLASGEGNPDTPASSGQDVKWLDRRCDRSNNSFEAQFAARYRRANPNTKTDFVYLACSGASIPVGLLGPYAGIHPETPDLPAQVAEAKRLAGNRKATAVLISAGINDLQFGNVAYFCAKQGDDGYCPDRTYSGGLSLADWLKQQIAALPSHYEQLATALAPLAGSKRVFINQYPNIISSAAGQLCKEIYFRPGVIYGRYVIDEAEVKWLYENFFLPLNAAVRAAATKYGWTAVAPPPAFENHGYCTDDHWVVTYQESEDRQGDSDGTLHPNLAGQTAIANAVYQAAFPASKRR
jgi:lysophospholipase L1-like esterase